MSPTTNSSPVHPVGIWRLVKIRPASCLKYLVIQSNEKDRLNCQGINVFENTDVSSNHAQEEHLRRASGVG